MHVEFFLAIMVLAVALLVAADFVRRASEGPHEPSDKPAHDAGRGSFTPSPAPAARGTGSHGAHGVHAGLAAVAAFEPIRPTRPATGPPGSSRPVTGLPAMGLPATGLPDGGRADLAAARGSWLVRTRLLLLAAVSALAAAVATASVSRATGILGGPSYHSDISSIRDGATLSVIVAAAAALIALAIGGWAAVLLIRSVLRPLNKLRAGAVELAEVRLPDALQGGGRGPLAVRSIGISSSDELGAIARAFDQVQAEVQGMTSDDAGLRGKLGELFVELSSRSQALVERQIRLIDELEQGERDSGRRASLYKMDHIATRMRRHSQNLLVLAGHELPGAGGQPATLVDVIRAAASEIEAYERISLSAQPGVSVAGPAVRDVVHLLAELAENATALSAPDTPVDVSGRALASGGVLIDITDQGVGMNPEALAEANRRLDNPPAMDFAVSPSMGLFVVGRLAARHGIKVRLQPAGSGGLIAQVWLPDAIASRPDGVPGLEAPSVGLDAPDAAPGWDAGPGGGAHAAQRPSLPAPGPAAFDRDPAERVPVAGSMWSAPVLEDVRPLPSAPAADTRPSRDTWFDTGPQPALRRPHLPEPARSPASPVRTQPSSLPQRLVASPPPGRLVASAPPAAAQPAEVGAAVPDADAAEDRRLPIYEAVESDWFGHRRTPPGGSAAVGSSAAPGGSAAAGGSAPTGAWRTPADPGWDAARAAARPASSGTTTAGLPVRMPRANLVPGAVGGGQADKPPLPRSASAIRDRLSGFQRGTSQGRAAISHEGDDQG